MVEKGLLLNPEVPGDESGLKGWYSVGVQGDGVRLRGTGESWNRVGRGICKQQCGDWKRLKKWEQQRQPAPSNKQQGARGMERQ